MLMKIKVSVTRVTQPDYFFYTKAISLFLTNCRPGIVQVPVSELELNAIGNPATFQKYAPIQSFY
jgi:hypothetical protein